MGYEYIKFPFKRDSFDKYTKEEAQVFFDWFINQRERRITYLKKYIAGDNKAFTLDYTPSSLVPLWRWYEEKMVFINKTEEELEVSKCKIPQDMQAFIMNEKLSNKTMGICVDVAIYFAEVLIKNSKGDLYWGHFIKPKNKVDVNKPIVLGFKQNKHLNPIRVVYNCTLHSSKKRDSERLHNMYNVWMDFCE